MRTITTCDGTITADLREWIRGIEVIHIRWDDVCVEVAVRTSKFALLEYIEGYIAAQTALAAPVAQNAVAWPGLRDAVRLGLLGPGDADMVRQQVSGAQQTTHEDVTSTACDFLCKPGTRTQ